MGSNYLLVSLIYRYILHGIYCIGIYLVDPIKEREREKKGFLILSTDSHRLFLGHF